MRISDWSSDVCSSDLRFEEDCHLAGQRVDAHGNARKIDGDIVFVGEIERRLDLRGEHHQALRPGADRAVDRALGRGDSRGPLGRSEERTDEIQTLMSRSDAGFCWYKPKNRTLNAHA